jgi:hypothetical protein
MVAYHNDFPELPAMPGSAMRAIHPVPRSKIARLPLCVVLLFAFGAAACSFGDSESQYPSERRKGQTTPITNEEEGSNSVFGEGGLVFGDEDKNPEQGVGIGVNSFLWRASLDTVSFMPLLSADPFGGVIITDWFSPPQTADERFKVNVFILGRTLRADGVRAAVFRQQKDGGGQWADASVAANTAIDLENAILTRARQLKIAQLGE